MNRQQNGVGNVFSLWEQRRRFAAVYVICLVVNWLMRRRIHRRDHIDHPIIRSYDERKRAREELIHHVKTSTRARALIRMGPATFNNFCDILRTHGGLTSTRLSSVEEQVITFLNILGVNQLNRTLQCYFRRSGETVSRHFHRVLRAMILLEEIFLQQPDGSEVPPEIANNTRFWPYFKDCVGAIGGTHIRVKVSTLLASRYRGREDYPTQNVLAACSFDMKFTYVLTGWEGTASDSRIIENALRREDNLKIPEGKYYLLDCGIMHRSELMAPYRGERYHLKEYSTQHPQNLRELFNLRHSYLRNTIERSFGVLKRRFPIVGSTEPRYSVDTQSEIILACCILHNYLMAVDPDEELIADVDSELEKQTHELDSTHIPLDDDQDAQQASIIRDHIAMSMWNDYVAN